MQKTVLLAFLAMLPGRVEAKELQVRLYNSQLPSHLRIEATSGQLRWRECAACAERSGSSLQVESANSELLVTTETAHKANSLEVNGAYILRPSGAPVFSASFPLQLHASSGQLFVIVSLPVEAYVAGVLAAEGGSFDNGEALKAMAVAVRTYAAKFPGRHESDGFDFCDNTHCQVFQWSGVSDQINSAVAATRGEILRYGGTPAATYYHQDCGGRVAAAKEVWPTINEPYLVEHPDPYCSISGGLKWETAIPISDIDRALRASGIAPPQNWKTMGVASRTASGRAKTLKLSAETSKPFLISASTVRFAVGRALGWSKIRSDFYELRSSGDHVVFSGRGSGHGVGLCQAGAEEMGREGKTYREILSFYYRGTELGAEAASTQDETFQMRSSERFELLSADPEADSSILPIAERILREDESSIGWKLQFRARLQIFPTLDRYRDTTGKPGWVAASTRKHVIRLQPLAELRRKEVLESTMRHEFFHLLVEARAREDTPLWFREGLVLHLSDPNAPNAPQPSIKAEQIESILRQPDNQEKVRLAYDAARAEVDSLIKQYGKQKVLDWLSTGIPGDVGADSSAPSNVPAHQ